MEKERLQKLLAGKVITNAELSHGMVKFTFGDGTSFEREKTFEGEIIDTLFDQEKNIILTIKF
jgi:hypothetical protein